jgi:hypothetical protein
MVALRVIWIFGSTSDLRWVFYSLREIYIFICNRLIKIYILFMKLNQPYDELYVLRNLISFDYVQIISMMFKS